MTEPAPTAAWGPLPNRLGAEPEKTDVIVTTPGDAVA